MNATICEARHKAMQIPDKVSLLIIGGGITGLSTALTWALNNAAQRHPVLIVEKEAAVGGYVTSFKREGYLFDTVQLIPEASDVLDYFGIDIDLKKFDNYYARIFLTDTAQNSVKCINIPAGVAGFKSFLLQSYPAQSSQIEHFFSYTRAMFNELYHLKVEPTILEIVQILLRCRKIIVNSDRTFAQFIKKFGFSEPEILEILDVFAAFSGLPAQRVAALLSVSAMIASLDGSYRPYKGFIEFPLRMKQRVLELGGLILNKSKVVKILVENNRATGVTLADGRSIYADYIVTTIDPKVAMHELVGAETLKQVSKAYARKIQKVKMSASAFMINLGLDEQINLQELGFDCGYNLLTTGKDIYSTLYDYFDKNELYMNEDEFFVPVICPSLPIGKKNALTIFVYPAPIADWRELRASNYTAYQRKKEAVADFYLHLVEKYMIPDLQSHIVLRDIASPATFARYSGSPTGSKFDMAPYPENFGAKRLKMRTPIKYLFQPKFSHGIWPCLQAGIQVVDMIMDRKIMRGNSRFGR